MPVRIPTDASPQLQEALREIERRLRALEWPAAVAAPAVGTEDLDTRLKTLERGPVFGVEWLEMVASGPQHARGLTPDTDIGAGLGHERALHADGTWRRPIDGLVQAVPVGVGRPANATRVVEVLADLAIAGGIGATDAFLKSLVVQGAITSATAALVSLAISGALTVGGALTVSGFLSAPFVGARAYRSAVQAINDDSVTVIAWTGGADYDTNSFFSAGANTRLTVPTGLGGYYLIQAQGNWGAGAITRAYIDVQKGSNGSNNTNNVLGRHDVAGASLAQNVSVVIHLDAADYVELFAYQDSAGAVNFGTLGSTYHGSPWFAITRLGT